MKVESTVQLKQLLLVFIDSLLLVNFHKILQEVYKHLHTSVLNFFFTAGAVASVYSAKAIIRGTISNLSFAADALAISKVEIKLDDIPEGRNVTVSWRGKPLFVKHRTDEEIEIEQAVDISQLRDPQTDAERAINPKFLILVGVCTHLG